MIALAWKFIKFDRAKSIGIITAIVISIFLIGQQLGLMFFLMGLMGNLVANAPVQNNQVWIIESNSTNINSINPIDIRYLNQVSSIPLVIDAAPVVLAPGQASFLDGKTAAVTLVGTLAPAFGMGPVPEKIREGSMNSLGNPDAVSAEFFNARSWDTEVYVGKPIEINGKSATISLITQNAQAFGASLMYTDLNKARFYGNVAPDKINLIIASVGTDGSSKEVQLRKDSLIRQVHTLFPNLRGWDPEKLRQSTVKEILVSSNMGMSFGTLVVFAMISGFFIIGLTLYSSALDRIKDYGTLKAIGARNQYVNRLIISQAFLYAIIGFSIALLLLYGFKMGVVNSGLVIDLNPGFLTFLLLITLFISVGGSLFAVRKIAKLEPASVF